MSPGRACVRWLTYLEYVAAWELLPYGTRPYVMMRRLCVPSGWAWVPHGLM